MTEKEMNQYQEYMICHKKKSIWLQLQGLLYKEWVSGTAIN